MIRINLLPRERARPPVAPPLRLGLIVVAVLLVAAVVATLFLNQRNAKVEREIADLNDEITALQPQVKHVQELQQLIEAADRKERLLKQLEALRVPWAQVLTELRGVIPQDVWLTQISASNDGNLVFNGFGLAYVSVARFMVNLEASQMFQGTDLTVTQKQKIGARDVVTFSVTSRLTARRTEASTR